MVKLVAFLKRKPGMTPEEFYERWENHHGPLIAGTPELARHVVRYEQHRRTDYAGWMGSPEYDGVTIQWLTGPEALEAWLAEPAVELINEDEVTFLDRDALVWMITAEPVVVIDGPTE